MRTTAQQILQSLTLPEGFDYEPIGFTTDGWVVMAPNGAELEFGTVTDDAENFEGYTWQEYADGMEEGNVTDAGGDDSEAAARKRVNDFISANR